MSAPCCCPRRLRLALRAEERAPPADLHDLDRGAAASARQPRAAIYLELVLELAGLAEQVHVGLVVERGAAEPDRLLQNLLHRPVEAPHLLRRQRVRHPVVPEPGGEE